MLIFTHKSAVGANSTEQLTLSLTAEERTRSRHRYVSDEGREVYLHLPRGTVLQHGECLSNEETSVLLRIVAKLEPVLTVRGIVPGQLGVDLLRAAYHLGNRHVSLEITADYLRLSPDPVLQHLLEHLGLSVLLEVVPFHPETGAYNSHHNEADHTHG